MNLVDRHTGMRVLLAIAFLGAFLFSRGQTVFGVKAGVNVSAFRMDAAYYPDYLTTYNVGLLAERQMTHRLAILAELLYSRQGNSTQLEPGAFHADYLSLPILAEYRVAPKWQIILGIEVGYLLNAYTALGNYHYNALSSFRRHEAGIVSGVRYHLTRKWGVEARYVYGMTGMVKYNDWKHGQKNMVFQSDIFFAIP